MYEKMTNAELLVHAYETAHPAEDPSSEDASLIDELCDRLRKMEHEQRDEIKRLCDQVEALVQALEKYRGQINNEGEHTAADDLDALG